MQYHIEIFQRLGIDELVLGVGHHHKDIAQGIVALGAQDFVRTVFNENYEEGTSLPYGRCVTSLISESRCYLWTLMCSTTKIC